ncbi:MAG: DUF4097 family beta strand repeat protein [Luteitalea sp.]|nr:DUF4097 family beta strand repeat protein [Luteitalea sp.]
MIIGALVRWLILALAIPAAGLLAAPPLSADPAPRPQEQRADSDDRIVRTLRVNDGDVLELHNIAGDITITGTEGNKLHIDARKNGRRGAAIDVEIVQRAARVEVRTRARRGNGSRGEVDYTLRVPASMVLDVHTVSGDVEATNVHGRATLRAVSGDIVASGLTQLDAAETLSGDVRISSTTATGNANIKTTSGSVTLGDIKAGGLKVTSVSGDVRLGEVSTTRLEVTSLSGDVEFSGPLSPTGRYTINSHSGDVRFQPSDQTGFELTAGSFSGSVRSDLPVTMQNLAGGRGRRNVQGVVGDGAASVDLTTFSGDITILK